MGCGSVDVHSMLYPLITLVQCCKPSFIFCFPLYSSHAKKAVQDYETQDKARESFGEKGGKIIHGCLTGSKQPCAIKFVSCHVYFVSSVLERFLLWICDRQIWNPCLLMSQHIWGLLWVHQALHLDGTTVQSVVVLQTTRVWGVEQGSVLAAVKSYTMIRAAWNLWLDQLDIQATLWCMSTP